jgi:transcriptional regulator with XRE-family HTH domain
MNAILGARIRTLREEVKLTQEQVSEKLSWTRQKYARLEKGMVDISYSSLVNIAKILNVAVDDITKALDGSNSYSPFFRSNGSVVGEAKFEYVIEMIDTFYEHKNLYNSVKKVDSDEQE